MSNQERRPEPVVCEPREGTVVELLEPRDVPLGGLRAMAVRRTLPQRTRTTIGAWCFVDHYGPADVSASGGMDLPPHPHTGLQTVSWLFRGEIEHRDSVGSHQLVHPGELNLMTAGHGISHTEVSTERTSVLHGAQLWLALPDASREVAPFFEHHEPDPATPATGVTVRVFIGELAGVDAPASPATVFSPLVGAEIDLAPATCWRLPTDHAFEYGVLLDQGDLRVDGAAVPSAHLAYLPPGSDEVELTTEKGARLLLLGGEPFGERIVMWWNFIGRGHDEIEGYRAEWERDGVQRQDPAARFGVVGGYDGPPLPAPALPNVRLKPRG